MGGVPHGIFIARYLTVVVGGGCGDVGARVMRFSFKCAIYSQAFGRGAGVFCAVAVWNFLIAKNGGAIKHGILLCDNFFTLLKPCFIVPILFVFFYSRIMRHKKGRR